MGKSLEHIRNFSIIAHIDHGKSTFADRLLEFTGTIAKRDMKEQILDRLDLERERGITIKAQSARIQYTAENGKTYQMNLIDTPGHVDFSYEVSRSLAACEGAILIVDASQGVEAQTIANLYTAIEQNVEIIPVMNKIDLPAADPENVARQIMNLIGCDREDILPISAKMGTGTREVLEAIVKKVPPPKGDTDAPVKALVIDSIYDNYRGVIAYLRVFDGELAENRKFRFMATGKEFEIEELGFLKPEMTRSKALSAGEVGYLISTIRDARDVGIGDTVTMAANPAPEPLPGYKEVKPMVFCGLFPTQDSDFGALRDALEKFKLNDASFSFEAESSAALGFGFRCGFLGLLHMDVVQERLEREFEQELITTSPNVAYEVVLTNGERMMVDNPSNLPDPSKIETIAEPMISATIITDQEYVGNIMKLVMDRRGVDKGMEFLEGGRVIMRYEMPLSEIVTDFYDKLKSVSRGYASLDYEVIGFRIGDLVKVDMLLNGGPVDALSIICTRDESHERGKELAERLRKVVPRQQFDIAIQAAIGNNIVARETVKALRKNVTAKCYGGDISRKRKLLERQKEGKKRMKRVGSVELPQEAFMTLLDRN